MKKLTNKQTLFAKHCSTGKSGKVAAILAGYSERSAEAIASENLRKPEVLQRIEEILDKAGLSDENLARSLQEAIGAGLGKKATNADAIKGIRTALELKDRFPSPRQKIDISQTNQVALTLQGKSREEMLVHLQEITKKTQYYISKLKELDKEM